MTTNFGRYLCELIRFREETIEIKVHKLLSFEISENQMKISLDKTFIDEIASLSNVVFFESPPLIGKSETHYNRLNLTRMGLDCSGKIIMMF